MKRTAWILSVIVVIVLILGVSFHLITTIIPPDPGSKVDTATIVQNPQPDFYFSGNNWMKKSNSGLWEMYLEGKPFERGVINGKLSKFLIVGQEQAFVDQIKTMVPSDFYLRFLKYFIYWFNRHLDEYIPEEYKLEIYGISLSASSQFDFIGSKYQRMLNYHSAHDIGHALQDLSLVGCTSFGVWGDRSKDHELIIGRNFDFYMGEEFAENKIICFEKPDKGYGFMMVTWGGMIGTMSGMNEAGLTVTINAAKSDIPYAARTPISIVTREILQYASTLNEAYAIARKKQTFVSESILVGSGKENMAGIIEKSPYRLALVLPTKDYMACTNHFQSSAFASDPRNIRDKVENASLYRYKRLIQDISLKSPMDYNDVAVILRDKKGLNNVDPGYGNEKAINQLIAHHSIIFKPSQLKVWVSTSPWQLGKYVCYDLYEIFHKFAGLKRKMEITDSAMAIPADSFLGSFGYTQFLRFKEMRDIIKRQLRKDDPAPLSGSFIDAFRNSNPGYYEVYSLLGDYYFQHGQWEEAGSAYQEALTKIVPRWNEKVNIIKKMTDCRNKNKKK
ncbi:MAG: C45 family autoproteolytic acyltransferase/hydrolase [Bacteroidales bacterium]|nr:C45 family autoproteolytic acyltransferase/hydrolase [Bacteroidales bacterium]